MNVKTGKQQKAAAWLIFALTASGSVQTLTFAEGGTQDYSIAAAVVGVALLVTVVALAWAWGGRRTAIGTLALLALLAAPMVAGQATSPGNTGEAIGVNAAAGGTWTTLMHIQTGTCGAGLGISTITLGTTYNVCVWANALTGSDHWDATTASIYYENNATAFSAFGSGSNINEDTWADIGDFSTTTPGTYRMRIAGNLHLAIEAVPLATTDSDGTSHASNRFGWFRGSPTVTAMGTFKGGFSTADNHYPVGESVFSSFTLSHEVPTGTMIANGSAITGFVQEVQVVGIDNGTALGGSVTAKSYTVSARGHQESGVRRGATPEVYLFGGDSPSGGTTAIERVNMTTGVVTTMSAVMPFATYGVAWVYDSNRDLFFGFGGIDSGSQPQDEIYRYNPATDTRTTLGATLGSGMAYVSAAWNPATSLAYIFGGRSGGTAHNMIQQFNTSSETGGGSAGFTLPADTSSTAAEWVASAGAAYIFGGDNDAGSSVNTIRKFVPGVGASTLSATLPVALQGIGSAHNGASTILLVGGYSTSTQTATYVFNTTTETIANGTATMPAGIYSGAVVYNAPTYYYFGGYTTSYSSTVYEIDVAQGGSIKYFTATYPVRGDLTTTGFVGSTNYGTITLSKISTARYGLNWTPVATFGDKNLTIVFNITMNSPLTGEKWIIAPTNHVEFDTNDHLTITGGAASPQYANRGESVTFSGTLTDFWGDPLDSRSVTLRTFTGSTYTLVGNVTTNSGGAFSTPLTISTSATDTYASTTPSVSEARDTGIQLQYPPGLSVVTDGTQNSTSNILDVDANYYLSSSTRAWATVMRNDQQRVTGTIVGVRSQTVPNATPVTVDYVDGSFVNRGSCSATTTSGVTSVCDTTISNSAVHAPVGTWTSNYTVPASAGSNQNSMSATSGQTFTLSRTLTLTGTDVDVAGQSTTAYFNLGETVRFNANVFHADGSAYRRLMADGSTVARTVRLHGFANTRGETGSFTTQTVDVNPSTGAITAVSTDTQISSSATDTYVDPNPSVAETKDWDVYFYAADIANGGFETYTVSPGAPNAWTNLGGTGGSQAVEATIKRSGSNAVRVRSGTNSVDMGIYQDLPTLTAGDTYNASVWQRTDGQPNTQARIEVYDVTAASAVASANGVVSTTTFTQVYTTFVPISGHAYRIKLIHVEPATNNRDIYFDDASVVNVGASTSNDGNAATQVALFDIDSEYHIQSSTRAWATVMRNDQQRVTGTIVGVRSQGVPESTPVLVEYRDPSSVVQGSCNATTVSGTTQACDITLSNTATASPTGTWTSRYSISASAATNQNFLSAALGQSFTVSATIGFSATPDIDVAGQSTTKYFNRGESVRTTATLLHADGSAYRRLMADGSTQARTAFVHLYNATSGSAGSVSSGSAAVNSGTGALTATSTDTTLGSTFPDTYLSTSPGQAEATDADMAIIEGGAGSDSNGNRGTQTNLYDVDGAVYVDAFFENDANVDANDTDFNTADSDNADPNTDYSRLYIKNVRGDFSNQFNNLRVVRDLKSPQTGSTQSTATLTLTNSGSGGLYNGNHGVFATWSTSRIDHTATSADTNGNTVVNGAVTAKTFGEAHYFVGRTTPSEVHQLRGDTENLTLAIRDTYDDVADNGALDFSSASAPGSFSVDLQVLLDDSATAEGSFSNGAFTSGGAFSVPSTSSSTVDWRDIRWNIEQGEIGGLEFADQSTDFDVHARQGLGDNDGVYIVDDLTITSVVNNKEVYDPGERIYTNTTYAYTHASFSATTPANESYTFFNVTWRKPNGTLMPAPSYLDGNLCIPTSTDASGKTYCSALLTSTAQVGADYIARATTLQNTVDDLFDIDVVLGTPVWAAHFGSNSANAYENTTLHNRGEEVKLTVPIANNPEGYNPSTSAATDDDAGAESLDSSGVYVPATQEIVFEWTWKTVDAASEDGIAHAPLVTLTINGIDASATPSQAALLYNRTLQDIHTQKTDGLVEDDMFTNATEDKDFFIALDLVYIWVHVQNIRGEDWEGIPMYVRVTPSTSNTILDDYEVTTGAGGWTEAFVFSPGPPTGSKAIKSHSPDTGNVNLTIEFIMILSPNTDEYIVESSGWNNYLELGRNVSFMVRTTRYSKDNLTLFEYAPDFAPRMVLEWGNGNGTWNLISDTNMTYVAGTTYRFNWTVPSDGAWLDRIIIMKFGATFSGATKWSPQQAAVIQKGGSSPIQVYASPHIAEPGQVVRIVIQESFTAGDARTGNAAGTQVNIYDPSNVAVVLAANPIEVGSGAYYYNFSTNGSTSIGSYVVVVVAFDPFTSALQSGAATFAVGSPFNTTAVLNSLNGLNVSLSAQLNQTNSTLSGLIAQFQANYNATEAANMASVLVRFGYLDSTLSSFWADYNATEAADLVTVLARFTNIDSQLVAFWSNHNTTAANNLASILSQLAVNDGRDANRTAAFWSGYNATAAANLAAVLLQLTVNDGRDANRTAAFWSNYNSTEAANMASVLVRFGYLDSTLSSFWADYNATEAANLVEILDALEGLEQANEAAFENYTALINYHFSIVYGNLSRIEQRLIDFEDRLNATLAQHYAALLAFQDNFNVTLAAHRSLVLDFWADMNVTLDDASADRQAKFDATMANIDAEAASLQENMTMQHDSIESSITSWSNMTATSLASHNAQMHARFNESTTSMLENFTLLRQFVSSENNESQDTLANFWEDENQTWIAWYAYYNETYANPQNLPDAINQTIRDEYAQQQVNNSLEHERYFGLYAAISLDYSNAIIGGLGEEILTNRELIEDGNEASVASLFWSSLGVDIAKGILYGLIAVALISLGISTRARRALKTFTPLGNLVAGREARRAAKEARKAAKVRKPKHERGRGRGVRTQ